MLGIPPLHNIHHQQYTCNSSISISNVTFSRTFFLQLRMKLIKVSSRKEVGHSSKYALALASAAQLINLQKAKLQHQQHFCPKVLAPKMRDLQHFKICEKKHINVFELNFLPESYTVFTHSYQKTALDTILVFWC